MFRDKRKPGNASIGGAGGEIAGDQTESKAVPPAVLLPEVAPVVSEAQRVAAQTSVSGRRAVSRGTIFLAFYLWLLSGVIMFSWIARRTQFFPGDMSITTSLQKRRNPWLRRFFFEVSEIGFPKRATPITVGTAGIFWALRFRLEAIFILLTSSTRKIGTLLTRSHTHQQMGLIGVELDGKSFFKNCGCSTNHVCKDHTILRDRQEARKQAILVTAG